MEDFSWLFENENHLQKRFPIKRIANLDDPDMTIPEVEEFSKGKSSKNVEKTNLSLSLPEEEFAEDANKRLEEAVQHLDVDQRLYDALATVIEELNHRRKKYQNKHSLIDNDKKVEVNNWENRISYLKKRIIRAMKKLTNSPITEIKKMPDGWELHISEDGSQKFVYRDSSNNIHEIVHFNDGFYGELYLYFPFLKETRPEILRTQEEVEEKRKVIKEKDEKNIKEFEPEEELALISALEDYRKVKKVQS